MTLILLFLPHGGGPPPPVQSAFTPAVLYAVETVRPSLTLVQDSEGEFTVVTDTYNG